MTTPPATTKRDGVLTIAKGRLVFQPEVYPTAHLANEGWRKEGDVWTAPYTAQALAVIDRLFPQAEYEGKRIIESRPLLQIAAMQHWSLLPLQSLPPQRPPSWDRLYPYQQRAAEWLASKRSALLVLAPGLGKSAVACTAAQMALPHQNLRVVVVCPLTLLGVWQREIGQWWPDALIEQREGRWEASVPPAPTIWLTTYDQLRLHGLPYPYCRADLLIFDESVLIKNRKAARTRAAWKARKQADRCWLLSGSPTTRFLDDLHAQLFTLEPKQYPSYWRFTNSVCLSRTTIWGTQVVANAPGAEEQVKRDLAGIAYFYNYHDLAREEPERAIPEWTFETRQVPLPEKWWRLYKQMQDRFMADLPDGNRVLAPNTLARLIRLLQLASHPALLMQSSFAELQQDAVPVDELQQDFPGALAYDLYQWPKGGKLSAIPGLLEELPGPTIIWTNFVATAKHLAERFKAPCLIGETPAEERTQIVQQFQAGEHPVLIAHPGVGRFGLTLTRGRSAIYAERDFSGDAYVQSLARIRRIGTTEPPQVVILEATGPNGEATVDRTCGRVLDYRKDRAEVLTTQLLREELG